MEESRPRTNLFVYRCPFFVPTTATATYLSLSHTCTWDIASLSRQTPTPDKASDIAASIPVICVLTSCTKPSPSTSATTCLIAQSANFTSPVHFHLPSTLSAPTFLSPAVNAIRHFPLITRAGVTTPKVLVIIIVACAKLTFRLRMTSLVILRSCISTAGYAVR